MRQDVELFEYALTECVNINMVKSFALIRWQLKWQSVISLIVGSSMVMLTVLSSCSIQQEPSLLSSKSTSGDTVQKVLENVPFAFDVAVDTISYNSCVGSELNQGGKLHGIKIGANEGFVDTNGSGAVKGGLKLKSDFLQYVAKNVNPTYPNTTIVPAQIQYILQNSEANQGLKIQYAIRTASDLKVAPDVINLDSSTVITPTRDGVYEGSLLSEEPVLSSITNNVKFGASGTILSEGARIYNIGMKSSPDAIEGSLGYSNAYDSSAQPVAGADDGVGVGEQYADIVRSKFNSFAYVLAVTFGNETTVASTDLTPSFGLNSPKRKTETDLRRAYGKGYELTFSSKNSALSSWRKNTLTRITEKNLEDGSLVSGVSWSCENFVIMKTNQLNNKKIAEPSCAELVASDLSVPAIAAKVRNIRRHYSEDLWGIGFYYGANELYVPATRTAQPLCLVNRQIDCYLPTTGIISGSPTEDVGVQYNSTQECYLSRFQQMGVNYIDNKTGDTARRLGRCAQYASVCTRSSTSY